MNNKKTSKSLSKQGKAPNPLKSGLPLQVGLFGGGHGGDVQEGGKD